MSLQTKIYKELNELIGKYLDDSITDFDEIHEAISTIHNEFGVMIVRVLEDAIVLQHQATTKRIKKKTRQN